MLKFIAAVSGFAAGVYFLVTCLVQLLHFAGPSTTGTELTVALVVLAVGTIVTALLVRLACAAVLLALTRGAVAFDWSRPNECTSFEKWFMCSWNFYGQDGTHEGLRFCGLGLAFQGDHGQAAFSPRMAAAR